MVLFLHEFFYVSAYESIVNGLVDVIVLSCCMCVVFEQDVNDDWLCVFSFFVANAYLAGYGEPFDDD